jgi:hypothetical protein
METYCSRPKTPVTAEEEYLSTITFINTYYDLKFLLFTFHMLKVQIKDHLSEQESGIHWQRLSGISRPLKHVLTQYFYSTSNFHCKTHRSFTVVGCIANARILFILNAVTK